VLRIIDGQIFEGKPSEDRFFVTLHDLGNGQKEACIQRATDWEHVGPLDPDSIAAQVLRGEREDPDAADKRRANALRAARRAKTKVRRLCKAFGCDHMLTLTYRDNQGDLDLCKKHVREFVRRLRRLLPAFRYVACFERQERGAWHCHMAVRAIPARLEVSGVRLKSFDALRSVWRGVVGLDNGNIDVSDGHKKGRRTAKRRSPARLAAYMSKYMLKDFDAADAFVNRYSASEVGTALPQAVRMEFSRTSLQQLLPEVFSDVAKPGTELFTWLSRWGDVFYIASEPEVPRELAAWEI
jgi:hypothetical protein